MPKQEEMEKEVWKPIDGFENYQVSNFGRVKSLAKKHCKFEKILKPSLSRGYYGINLSKSNKIYRQQIHRLIAKAFIPNPDNKPHINHINGIKHDNRIENLEWCTQNENMQHAYNTGLCKRRKLTKEEVNDIHQLNQTMTHREIAKKYCVCHKVIWLIANNKTYTKIPLPE